MNRRQVTSVLTRAGAWWLSRRPGAIYAEATISDFESDLRLDLVHIGPRRRPRSLGIEVKSCRADYTSDSKLHRYIGRVNELYVLTMPGVLTPEELPEPVGLLELYPCWTPHRSLADRREWKDLLLIRKLAAVCAVSIEHEVDLLRGLALGARKVSLDWAEQLIQANHLPGCDSSTLTSNSAFNPNLLC